MAETRDLPEFDNPPVSEVVLGVQFDVTDRWAIPQFGAYWTGIRADYPRAQVQPPIIPQIELFGQERFKQPDFLMFQDVPARCWFMTQDETRLIQVQRDRFVVNWRKVKGDEVYPRFDTEIRPRFASEWRRFLDYLSENSAASPNVTQCEVTYINDIEEGTVWKTFADLHNLIRPWSGEMTDRFLPAIETMQFKAAYPLPNEQGRLHVETTHAFRKRDMKEILQLSLTARGRPASGTLEGILAWFDLGREWIVRGFADVTTPVAHEYWKRRR
jgi:uncharacterized protein (TIGR04255 family)